MYQFTEDCLIGIEGIDEEHRQLFHIINQASAALEQEGAAARTKELLPLLKSYADTHFAHEEEYMERIQDPELPRQQKEHRDFVKKMEGIRLEGLDEKQSQKVLKEVLEYLARWLYHHILGSDILIGRMQKAKEDPFAFTSKYLTNIPLVDEEHRQLFQIIRRTNDLIQDEFLHDKYDEIVGILAELKEYTVHHFQDEEMYMERIGYRGLKAQQLAHQAFIDKLAEVNLEEIDHNQQQYLNELVDFLLSWLSTHILRMDKLIPAEKNRLEE